MRHTLRFHYPCQMSTGTRRRKVIVPHDSTALLNQLRLEEKEREKEMKKQQAEEKRKSQEAFMAGLQAWEDELMPEPIRTQMRAMWEVGSPAAKYHEYS